MTNTSNKPKPHVYVVLEFQTPKSEPQVHGVFSNREHAEHKAYKLSYRHHRPGYIAVLKQTLRGG